MTFTVDLSQEKVSLIDADLALVEERPLVSHDERPRRALVGQLLLGLGYYLSARLSLHFTVVGDVVTPIWPPTGIALVGLLICGRRVWPAITVSALLVNLPVNDSLGTAALIAVGNTLAPLLAVCLLRAAGFRPELDRLRDAAALVVLGALLAMTVSATVGTAALWLSSAIPVRDLVATWSVWWAGDATGILVFAPLLLSLRHHPRYREVVDYLRASNGKRVPLTSMAKSRGAEAASLLAALVTGGYFVFGSGLRVTYLMFPLLIAAAVRFGQVGASVATLVLVLVAVGRAIDGVGLFAETTLLERMLTLQTYNAVVALTSLVLSAAMAERAEAQALQLSAAQTVAHVLQHSLLPERLPEIPGVSLAGRYLPGAAGLEVGGDWYDVFPLPGGRVGLVIGDVVGRGLRAAVAMGQLRTALRVYARETGSPATVVERLNGLVNDLNGCQMATVIYAVLEPETGRLTFTSAGHPPALLAGPDGTVSYLEEGRFLPLGVSVARPQEAVVVLEPGSTLLHYTDGLVEMRGDSIEDGMEALRHTVKDGHSGDLDSLCDERILQTLRPGAPADDVTLLALRLLHRG